MNGKKSRMINSSLLICIILLMYHNSHAWGFYGHKLVNRNAVFTLPESMLLFFKRNMDYIVEHAVDPDKRRYNKADEACRHYIDLDYYERSYPIDTVPLYWKDAVSLYSEDTLLSYGIVPWHVQKMLYRLTEAFKNRDFYSILHNSADIGHYMADACVPLHATMNYNGQLTGQHGIHGLWESRLPELFSLKYHLFTGKAQYLYASQARIWDACSGSFNALDSVLRFEKILNDSFTKDQKYILQMKGRVQVKNYAPNFALAYHTMLSGMVERRLKLAIHMVGCLWYTAWIDAGQPDLSKISSQDEKRKSQFFEDLQKINDWDKMIGRPE